MILLSVIIPTRNRCSLLKQTLESISKQTFDKNSFEVIVVDNGSTDDTKSIVDSFNNDFPYLSYIYDERPGLHNGRHDGYKNAKSDILVYADDDIIAFPTWLEGVWESFQDPEVVLVGGKNLPKYEAPAPFWIKELWYRMTDVGNVVTELSIIDMGDTIKRISPYCVYGCNYSIRKKILDETKGFHPDGMPFELIQYRGDGEWFVNKYISSKKYKVLYNPKASIYHCVTKERLTLDYFKKHAFCTGVELSYNDLRYKSNTQKKEKRTGILLNFLKRFVIHRKIYKGLHNVAELANQTDIDIEIGRSQMIGYNYHQWMFNHDDSVREWVLKDNYLD